MESLHSVYQVFPLVCLTLAEILPAYFRSAHIIQLFSKEVFEEAAAINRNAISSFDNCENILEVPKA